jgi:hypothetical protein
MPQAQKGSAWLNFRCHHVLLVQSLRVNRCSLPKSLGVVNVHVQAYHLHEGALGYL